MLINKTIDDKFYTQAKRKITDQTKTGSVVILNMRLARIKKK